MPGIATTTRDAKTADRTAEEPKGRLACGEKVSRQSVRRRKRRMAMGIRSQICL
jgi:hypothetical protein